jgi:hypothetical protein
MLFAPSSGVMENAAEKVEPVSTACASGPWPAAIGGRFSTTSQSWRSSRTTSSVPR